MTESEWLNSTPQAMLSFLRGSGKLSKRKARLFAAAACRRFWRLMADDRSQKAVEVSERYADGQAGKKPLAAVRRAAFDAHKLHADHPRFNRDGVAGNPDEAAQFFFSQMTLEVATAGGDERFDDMARIVSQAGFMAMYCLQGETGETTEKMGQADLLRDICGPWPFHPLPLLDPKWLAWNEGVITRLAEAAYENRMMPRGELDSVRLAVLADALEEEGADAVPLNHLREQGSVHVRGCWVVDGVLGKS